MNARFWTLAHGSPVKLTLRPDESLTHTEGGATDEGWTRSVETFSFDGAAVTCERLDDGRDCDGRMTTDGASICAVGRLRAGWDMGAESPANPGVIFPAWELSWDVECFDEYAQAAGY